MLSRTFTKEQIQMHQVRHKHLPPQIDFSIMKDNQLKPVHYLLKHEEIKYNQKNDCHPILADYGKDQFSIRINNRGEDIQNQNGSRPRQDCSFDGRQLRVPQAETSAEGNCLCSGPQILVVFQPRSFRRQCCHVSCSFPKALVRVWMAFRPRFERFDCRTGKLNWLFSAP